jgi:endonuclease/exonuclease/phosphatase family metal-dependent hydrolase
MGMKCVSYNIQYGIGQDGRYDLERICAAIGGAEVIALQEVTRNSPTNEGRDMVAELRAALPEYFAVYGPNFEVDMGSHVKDGRAVDIRFQFGNMILSKTPILSSRNILLPRRRSIDRLNLQRGAIEALIDTPLGPVRFYSVHLDHRGPDERLAQVRHLLRHSLAYPAEGGALTGVTEMGFPEPPRPDAFMLLGDFNMLEGSPEYVAIAGALDHEFGQPLMADKAVDAARHLQPEGELPPTCINMDDPADRSLWKRIDYAFVSADLAGRLKSTSVDAGAVGSDHLPLWLELG